MWIYEKSLQYPVNIKITNPKLASFIISQYGGPDGEMNASMQYLSQRYSIPDDMVRATLTDIGTEELGHLEMIGSIIRQLTRGVPDSQIEQSPFAAYFIDHNRGIYPVNAAGSEFNAKSVSVKNDVIADLVTDMAAEQKARATYDNILKFTDDPDVKDAISFLRAREVVHFQRFGETLNYVQCKKCME